MWTSILFELDDNDFDNRLHYLILNNCFNGFYFKWASAHFPSQRLAFHRANPDVEYKKPRCG